MHERLRDVLTDLVAEDLVMAIGLAQSPPQVASDLVARYVAWTFVLVLDWWIEREAALTPTEVGARFRALVLPTLAARCPRAG